METSRACSATALTPVTLQELSRHAFPALLNDRKPENLDRAQSGEIKVLDYGIIDFTSEPLYQFPNFP